MTGHNKTTRKINKIDKWHIYTYLYVCMSACIYTHAYAHIYTTYLCIDIYYI